MSGRHYLLGVFAEDGGRPLWLNPAALEGHTLTAPYPESQRERSCDDIVTHQREGSVEWYGSLRAEAVRLVEKTGEKATEGRIHTEVIAARTRLYVAQGVILKDARPRARAEADIARGQWQLGRIDDHAQAQTPRAEDVGRALLQPPATLSQQQAKAPKRTAARER